MKRWILAKLLQFIRWLRPQPSLLETDLASQVRFLGRALAEAQARENRQEVDYLERVAELLEARQMAGAGPWRVSAATIKRTDELIGVALESYRGGSPVRLRETNPIAAQGAFGDIELALQNVEWRREISLSWLEFSRWGIQQIMLISRLHYIKNPLIQRGINVASHYVFGRGYELSSPDGDADDVLQAFLEANKKTLGQIGLAQLEKRLYYDGQVFFVLFADTTNKGGTLVRTIDATEIFEIVTDPDDTERPWFYDRQWTARAVTPDGVPQNTSMEAWYPALEYVKSQPPPDKSATMRGKPINWDSPVLHMRGGTGVSKWHFDVPIVYAALDWAKASRQFLESCLTVKKSLAQISMTLTTKGGQQALQGAKSQLETTVNSQSGNSLWDTNPTAVAGAIFASGPGTTLAAFNTKGAGGDPEEVRRYIHMVAMVFGLPETFFADASTGSLATAVSLDRPTELRFLESQERWRETLVTIAQYALDTSMGAVNGQLRNALERRKQYGVVCIESPRVDGKYREAKKKPDQIEIRVTFPAIREGDLPALVLAITNAMTLQNKGGQVLGIDEKVGVRLLFEQLGVEHPEDVLEEMYPEAGPDKYDPLRTKEPEPAPPTPALLGPAGAPQGPGGPQQPPQPAVQSSAPGGPPQGRVAEAARRFVVAVQKARDTLRA